MIAKNDNQFRGEAQLLSVCRFIVTTELVGTVTAAERAGGASASLGMEGGVGVAFAVIAMAHQACAVTQKTHALNRLAYRILIFRTSQKEFFAVMLCPRRRLAVL